MHLFSERRLYHNWPRIKEYASDGYRVQGFCPTVARWRALRFISLVMATTFGIVLLAAATMGAWGPAAFDATEGTGWFIALKRLASVQRFFYDLLTEQFPSVGQAVGYGHQTELDWHLGVLAVACLAGRQLIAEMLAGLLSLVLRPLAAKRIRITITPERVRLDGAIFSKTLDRDDNGPEPIRFRVASAGEYYSKFAQHGHDGETRRLAFSKVPPAVVEMAHGFRRYQIVFALREDQAEAVVDRCNEVMLRTQPLVDTPIT